MQYGSTFILLERRLFQSRFLSMSGICATWDRLLVSHEQRLQLLMNLGSRHSFCGIVVVEQAHSNLQGAMAPPPFHMIGIIVQLLVPVYKGTTILLWDLTPEGHPVPVPTPENTIQTLETFGCDSTLVMPSFLVTWAQNEKAVEYLSQMDYIVSFIFWPLWNDGG